MVCLLESACQKLLIAFLVFGTNFFKAIDQAAMSLAKSFHVDTDFSLVWTIFAVYLIAHILVGMILGFWIPKLPGQIQKSFVQVPAFEPTAVLNPKAKRSRMTMLVLSLTTVLLLLLFIRVALPSQPVMQLVYIFIRSIIVSMLLVIVVGPAVLFLVKKILKNKSSHNNVGASFVIINHLPEFSSQVYQMFVWVNQSFTGIQKIKHYILGLFVVSTRSTDRFRI
jgi:NAD/NADP transhydrogenase beta subunit